LLDNEHNGVVIDFVGETLIGSWKWQRDEEENGVKEGEKVHVNEETVEDNGEV